MTILRWALILLAILIGLRGFETAWSSMKWFKLGRLWPVGIVALVGGSGLITLAALAYLRTSWWFILAAGLLSFSLNWLVVVLAAAFAEGSSNDLSGG